MKTSLIRIFAFVCCALSIAVSSSAQAQKSRTTISYLIGFPVDDTNDFINSTSFLGFDADLGMQILNEKSEVSLVLGFQRFKKTSSNASFTDPASGAVLTADQERSLTSVPILLKWRYYPYSKEAIRGFVSLAAGGTYVERRFFVGSFDLSKYGWQFLVRPEAGISYSFNPAMAVEGSLRYDYGVATSDLPTIGAISIGLGFTTYF